MCMSLYRVKSFDTSYKEQWTPFILHMTNVNTMTHRRYTSKCHVTPLLRTMVAIYFSRIDE